MHTAFKFYVRKFCDLNLIKKINQEKAYVLKNFKYSEFRNVKIRSTKMPPKRRLSSVTRGEPIATPKEETKRRKETVTNDVAHVEVKQEVVPKQEDTENTTRRIRHTRATSGSASTGTSITYLSDQTASQSQSQHSDMNLYLEDFFHAVCTQKDSESARYLSVVFYLLPSEKVSDSCILIFKIIDSILEKWNYKQKKT